MLRPTAVLLALAAAACSGGPRESDGSAPAPLDRLVERAGGSSRLASLRALAYEATLTMEVGGSETVSRVSQEIVFPDSIRTEIASDGATTVAATDGRRAWKREEGGVVEIDAEEARRMVDDAQRFVPWALSRLGTAGFGAESAGSSEVEGEACDEIRLAARGVVSTICVAADGRPLRQTYEEEVPLLGGRGRIDVVFSDHRTVSGVLFPFRETFLFEGRPFARASYRSVRIDPRIEPSRFRPE